MTQKKFLRSKHHPSSKPQPIWLHEIKKNCVFATFPPHPLYQKTPLSSGLKSHRNIGSFARSCDQERRHNPKIPPTLTTKITRIVSQLGGHRLQGSSGVLR